MIDTYKVEDLLKIMAESKASDLFISIGAYPTLKIGSEIHVIEEKKVTFEMLETLRSSLLTEQQQEGFRKDHDLDFIYSFPGVGRFRINYFQQRGSDAFVIHQILNRIKSIDELALPVQLKNLTLKERGLILVVGQAGSGKSTTIAAMIDHRNATLPGHILTLEDPIEFLHSHKKSIVNQREIGHDAKNYTQALKSALRESPSMISIGEIRDIETMSAALNFSETGHLVISTLHAVNTSQTIERIVSFFDPYLQVMVRSQISNNLEAVIAQRLVPGIDGNNIAAHEIMFPSARVKDLIQRGDTHLLKTTIEASNNEGMQSFDQSLFNLYREGRITRETAVWYADNQSDLRLRISTEEEQEASLSIQLKTGV
ncbi:MAG: PilT/PilU family type 4a pilus ATPase [FCB group bacterium]|nr:PilT/PilU family type 4a pilus ATPase [FCB group bacterium]